MNMTDRRLRSMGWVATLVVCAALVMVLAFRVNALRSQVYRSQARIIALKQETMYLETEFETRANQQQLKSWNDVEFGYVAPAATQYLDNERELVSYAKPVEPGAPAPIRVASTDDQVAAAAVFPAMVSPLTGKPPTDSADTPPAPAPTPIRARAGDNAVRADSVVGSSAVAVLGLASLNERLGTVHHSAHAVAAHKSAKAKDGKKLAKDTKARTRQTHPKDEAVRPASAGHSARHRGLSAFRADLASADQHRRPHSGSAPIRLALKDAKAAK